MKWRLYAVSYHQIRMLSANDEWLFLTSLMIRSDLHNTTRVYTTAVYHGTVPKSLEKDKRVYRREAKGRFSSRIGVFNYSMRWCRRHWEISQRSERIPSVLFISVQITLCFSFILHCHLTLRFVNYFYSFLYRAPLW